MLHSSGLCPRAVSDTANQVSSFSIPKHSDRTDATQDLQYRDGFFFTGFFNLFERREVMELWW